MKSFILGLLVLIFFSTSFFAFGAQIPDDMLIKDYQPIVNIPGLDISKGLTTEGYVNALYLLAITISALIAVVKIIFAGVKYTLSDVVTDKGSAIKDIKGSLLGLLIVLSAVLILNTINTDLTTINIFGNAPPSPTIGGGGGGPTPPSPFRRYSGPINGSGEYIEFVKACSDAGGDLVERLRYMECVRR